jgi:hypothetical protein
MAAYGIPQEVIGKLVYHQVTGKPISHLTIRKYFKHEISLGLHKANMKVAQSLFQKATSEGNGAIQAAIFWLRCRGGSMWKDRQIQEHELTDGQGGSPKLVIEIRDPTQKRVEKVVPIAQLTAPVESHWDT